MLVGRDWDGARLVIVCQSFGLFCQNTQTDKLQVYVDPSPKDRSERECRWVAWAARKPQTGINVRVFPALLQDRREVLTSTSTSGNPNAWSRV